MLTGLFECKAHRTCDGVHAGSGVRREKEQPQVFGLTGYMDGGAIYCDGEGSGEAGKEGYEVKSPALALFISSLY